MIVRLPGVVPARSVSHAPGYFADWFPTLCDAVGLQNPEGLDGQSLWPIMTGMTGEKEPTERKAMVWVFPEYGGQVAVRLGNMKVVRQGLKTKAVSNWEVYDLSVDASEKTDIAATHKKVVDQALEVLRREVAENKTFPLAIPGL